jgi:hypothetical protein
MQQRLEATGRKLRPIGRRRYLPSNSFSQAKKKIASRREIERVCSIISR